MNLVFNRFIDSIACKKGNREIFRLLLKNGGDVFNKDSYGVTPLMFGL